MTDIYKEAFEFLKTKELFNQKNCHLQASKLTIHVLYSNKIEVVIAVKHVGVSTCFVILYLGPSKARTSSNDIHRVIRRRNTFGYAKK